MKSRIYHQLLLLPVLLLFLTCREGMEEHQTNQKALPSVFTKMDPGLSGLNFSNTITEDISGMENLFNYDYFYNGAGTGIADLNNDGLLDVFFCGNQVNNKLFLNKGKLTFEEISESAGINHNKVWANGVTFVDINNDGWLDIYISQGGPNPREERKNLLYINQKNETFIEKADSYGLADMGISTQSVFFDFDKDGDLDCLVMNENEYYGVDPINLYRLVSKDSTSTYFNSSHLYSNDHGKFVDITKKAGLLRPIFGLGLSVSDINNDGWMDIYIASDYYIPDALFINNRDGTFTERIKEHTQHISFFGMGMDIADINNDGLQDIFVLDMAANDHIRSKTLMASMNTDRFDYLVNKADFHHQYMYNSLQLNQSNNKFSNISQATNMANTDWSWSVLMSDYDLDGDKDVFITNGYRRYALDNDLQREVHKEKLKYKGKVPLEVKKKLYESMPSEKLPNVLFNNHGNLVFKEEGDAWGLSDLSFSNGAAQGDLDNDGDLDLIVNNLNENCFLYRNTTIENNRANYLKVKTEGKLSESFPKVTIIYDGQSQFIENKRIRGYRSAQEETAHFGLGNHKHIDTVRVVWPSGKVQEKYAVAINTTVNFLEEENSTTVLEEQENTSNPTLFPSIEPLALGLDFTHIENVYDDFDKEVLLPYKQSTLGPFIAKGDVNGDGLEDFYVGGASGQAGSLYVQNTHGKFESLETPSFEDDRWHEDMEAVIFDADNDNDLDLFVVSGGNEFENHSSLYADRLYVNDGNGHFTKDRSLSFNSNPKSGKSVVALDFDMDGDIDLLVGNRIIPQHYPMSASSTLWENREGQFFDVTESIAPDLLDFGIINDIQVTDFDGDGRQDFIAVGEWSGIAFFRNTAEGFTLEKKNNALLNDKGWWFSVQETDINNDNLPDYVIGNVGANIKFSASEKKPFKVFANDFDDNGTLDIVLGKQYKGTYVPVRGRECSSQQMPFIQNKFKTYSEFANSNLIDIYGDKLHSAYEKEVTEFRSILLINKGDGTFSKSFLPIEAQLFPILESIVMDINGDGFEDIILGGNIYNTEVETPRLDALSGTILLSNGKDGYTVPPKSQYSLLLKGNIKDLCMISLGNREFLLATSNNSSLIVHEFYR